MYLINFIVKSTTVALLISSMLVWVLMSDRGTLKAGAKVLYITAKTAKTVSTTVNTGKQEMITGLQSIIDAYSKGKLIFAPIAILGIMVR